jgi:hypothetical protein
MDPLLQLIIVMPFVILFALIVAALTRQENQRFHDTEAAYQRRHVAHRAQVHSPVRSVRAQPDKESVEVHHEPLRRAA